MVKVKNDTPWITKEGIDQARWLTHLAEKNEGFDLDLIDHACHLSQLAGSDQPTEVGFSCFQQGLAMADLLVDLSVDSETIAAALVFDAVLHADLTVEDVAEQLGPNVAKLVTGVIQMGILSLGHHDRHYGGSRQQIDNIRKMLLSMVNDVRVVLIKLVERLCVLREIEQLPIAIRKYMATEVMEIFAPLANRLGIWVLKWELEDLSFKYLHPEWYQQIAKGLNSTRLARDNYVEEVVSKLTEALKTQRILDATVYGRSKHILSIYRKMLRKNMPLHNIYDVTAIRVLVDSPEDCYRTLGVVHALWERIASEFDDYVSQPKLNGYQSLHTVVSDLNAQTFEVQIRTYQMHELAEKGIAAHWKYKEGVSAVQPTHERKIEWLREVLAWHKEMARSSDAATLLEREFLEDRIYVFTPAGDVLDLPSGSTPLDFAYSVHTQIGHRCRGAKVNKNIVPLTYVLQMGDRIEILTGKEEKPSRDWLNTHLHYLFTARAKAKVLHWFKMQQEEDFPAEPIRGRAVLPSSAGKAKSVSSDKIEPLRSELSIEGVGRLLTNIARCCHPLPGDAVIGYVTIGRGVSIHKQDCPNIVGATEKQRDRFLQVRWGNAH